MSPPPTTSSPAAPWTASPSRILEKEQERKFRLPTGRRLFYRTRYFTDSGIIGTREYARRTYLQLKDHFNSERDKVPTQIAGLNDIYSLKRLAE